MAAMRRSLASFSRKLNGVLMDGLNVLVRAEAGARAKVCICDGRMAERDSFVQSVVLYRFRSAKQVTGDRCATVQLLLFRQSECPDALVDDRD